MQSSQDFFELSADFQNSGRETAPADLFLPWRRTFRKFLLAFVLSACALVSPAALAQSGQPNIIVILADDLGYGDVGFNGCPDYPTPNIDSLTINGVRCSSGYVTHPFCSPSRAALLTGRYQQRFGYENQPTQDAANPRLGVPAQELLLAQILQPAGYVCGAVGKWHLGVASNLHPMQRGFNEFFGFLDGASSYYNARLLRGTTQITEPAYLTDAFTREAVSFINRHATEPFFLYLSYNAVHTPFDTPPQNYMDRVENIRNPHRRTYAAMATALDDGVGQVLQALQGQNLLSNTLVFFLSDNGGENNPNRARNYPLRGYKFDVLEGGIHVPFVVQWTGRLPGNDVYDKPVSSLDIVATAAAAAGVQLPADRVYDGFDLIPFLAREQVAPPRTLFWRWFGLGASGPPCDMAGGSPDTIWAVRSGVLKLVAARDTTSQPASLYNLQTDIGETQDLAGARHGDVNTLTSLYNQWNSETIPPLWLANTDANILPLVLAGDWNGYNKGDTRFPWRLTRITAPGVEGTPDAFNWFTNTIHVATTGGDTTPGLHFFALVGDNSYSKQWGGVTINVDGTTSVPFFSGNTLGPTNTITFQNGYYSFRILDWINQIGASMKLAVMKTSAPPVTVRLNGRTPTTPTSDDSVNIGILTNQPKSVEERIYLRWSTDFFITSHMVEAAGSGLNYSATIPAQLAGTGVHYCVTTSTADLSALVTSGTIDPLTLATSSNSHFVVAPGANPSPTPTVTPPPTPTATVEPSATATATIPPSPTPTATPTATPAPSPTPTPTSTPTPTPGSFAAVILATEPANLKGYWKCNETSGTTLADSSGNSKNLTITGAINTNYWLGETGEHGTCFRTDGVAGYASRNDAVIPSLDNTNFTLFALFKGGTDFSSGGAVAISNTSTNNNRANIGANGATSQALAQARGNSTVMNSAFTDGTAFDGSWHSVAFRRNGTAFNLFVDGTRVASTTATFATGSTCNRTSLMHMLTGRTTRYAKGSIQHAAIWNTALSDSEIMAIQRARTINPTPTPTP